jgi:hypothetical protein
VADGWRDVAASAARLEKLVLPWETEGYRLERGKVAVVGATFVRKSALGRVLATVTSKTTFPGALSNDEKIRGVRREPPSTAYEAVVGRAKSFDSLAEALQDADAELEAQDYEVIGRVVWVEGSKGR